MEEKKEKIIEISAKKSLMEAMSELKSNRR